MALKTDALHKALLETSSTITDSPRPCEFVHLHVHSAFSLLEGALPLKDIIDLAIADNQPAIAITDRNNLFGALEFSEKASKEGLQPIMGAKLAVAFEDGAEHAAKNQIASHPFLVLIAMSREGFANLTKLISASHIEAGERDLPHVSLEKLKSHSKDLICLTGASEGPINPLIEDGRKGDAEKRVLTLKSIFGDRLYIELQRHGNKPRTIERELIAFAYQYEIPLVATNQPLYPKKDDFAAHDALTCIAEGAVVETNDRKRLTEEHYFKSQSEMKLLFRDIPEAIENTSETMRISCSNMRSNPTALH